MLDWSELTDVFHFIALSKMNMGETSRTIR